MMKLTGWARGHLMMFISISMHLIKCNPGHNYLLESLPMFAVKSNQINSNVTFTKLI